MLISGTSSLGDDTALQHLRLPKLLFRKGDSYNTSVTPNATIQSITLKPTADATGVGGRGMGQIINSTGKILAILKSVNGAQELVKLTF